MSEKIGNCACDYYCVFALGTSGVRQAIDPTRNVPWNGVLAVFILAWLVGKLLVTLSNMFHPSPP